MRKKNLLAGKRRIFQLRDYRRGLTRFFVRRNHKDLLFVKLFHDKSALLSLYNALNGTDYLDPEALEITTIDDVVYAGYKNDCSFIIGSYLNLYEHQSTFCPNMPLRGLLYLMQIYEGYIARHDFNLYGPKLIRLPTPKYIVFYNGTEERPEREELPLSAAFSEKDSCLEFTATMYNINKGKNRELMEQCATLEGYAILIDKIRANMDAEMELSEAVDKAIVYCINQNILRDFLSKHRAEVTRVLLTEYDAKKQRQLDKRDWIEEGERIGEARGRAIGEAIGEARGREIGEAQGLEIGEARGARLGKRVDTRSV